MFVSRDMACATEQNITAEAMLLQAAVDDFWILPLQSSAVIMQCNLT